MKTEKINRIGYWVSTHSLAISAAEYVATRAPLWAGLATVGLLLAGYYTIMHQE